jgi:hypothetical protein
MSVFVMKLPWHAAFHVSVQALFRGSVSCEAKDEFIFP